MSKEKIIGALQGKSSMKQHIYQLTLEGFNLLKSEIKTLSSELASEMSEIDKTVEISVKENGSFEIEFKFSGDTLLFMMHTNVFNLPEEHYLKNTPYVQKDRNNSYFGMIMIYNFLSDSLKYNRVSDTGQLIGRLYINRENNFFVSGQRQLSFLYKDLHEQTLNPAALRHIIETAVLQAIDFDLIIPPYESVKAMNIMQKMQYTGNAAIKTAKPMGFSMNG